MSKNWFSTGLQRGNKYLLNRVEYVMWFLIIVTLIHVLIVWPINSNLEHIYNAVNSILPFFTIILVYNTFNQQQKQLTKATEQVTLAKQEISNSEKKDFLNRVDQHFILSLGIHRENVAAMNFKGKIIGKEFFVEAFKVFEKIFNVLYITHREDINNCLNRSLTKNELIDISYKILFYGVDMDMPNDTLDHNFKLYDALLKPDPDRESGFGCFIYSHWSTQEGVQSNLSHYFRHLYHTVTYIHDLNIGDEEKLFYIKRIRGQFSNHEQAMFFINSLSIGGNWRKYKKEAESAPVDLITKYGLIKNLPGEFFEHINHKCYYKNIKYEEDGGVEFSQTEKGKRCREQFPV